MTQALTIREGVASLPTTVDEAVRHWDQFEELKRRLLSNEDYQTYGSDKRRIKKSGWRKLATAFDLDDRIISEEIQRDLQGRTLWAKYTIEVKHPKGRSAVAVHGAHVKEKCCPAAEGEPCNVKKDKHECCPSACSGFRHWSHMDDIEATAHTRAKNRAISDLVGGGETSAEEIDPGRDHDDDQGSSDSTDHYCVEHNTPFFKKGKMKGFAHPLSAGGWHNEPETIQGELGDSEPATMPSPAPALAKREGPEAPSPKSYTLAEMENGLGMTVAKWLELHPGKTRVDAVIEVRAVRGDK